MRTPPLAAFVLIKNLIIFLYCVRLDTLVNIHFICFCFYFVIYGSPEQLEIIFRLPFLLFYLWCRLNRNYFIWMSILVYVLHRETLTLYYHLKVVTDGLQKQILTVHLTNFSYFPFGLTPAQCQRQCQGHCE